MIDMNRVLEFVGRVVDQFKPERVILFGSYAQGVPTPDSDVDLLVILPFQGKTWHMASEIRRRTRPGFPLDLLVRTPEQLRQRLQTNDPFLREIAERGRLLYEARDI